MAYNGLTDLGTAYLAKCLANQKPIIFKKVKVGDGNIPPHKTGQTTTELYSFKKEVEILAKEQHNTAMKLTVLLNNLDMEQGFYVKEMGIYIEDDGVDKLYWYINKDNPSYLYDKNTPSKHRYNVYCEVSSNESVVVNFTGKGLLADKEYVDNSIKNFQTENNVVIERLENAINSKISKGNLPAQITDAKGIYDLLENNSGLNFDQNLLFLNYAGIKTVGKIYFDLNKKGMFKCIKQTTGTVNSTEFFEDISNNANSDRLSNLPYIFNEYSYYAASGYCNDANDVKLNNSLNGVIPINTNIKKAINLPTNFSGIGTLAQFCSVFASVGHFQLLADITNNLFFRATNGVDKWCEWKKII